LAIYSTACFLDFPPEIRDRIYNNALTAPRPITVSSVAVQKYQAQRNDSNQTVISHGYIVEGKDPILYEIATNLLFCHPTIAAEAAICFYQSNTFYFKGDEVWNPLYFFLQSIGDYNRSFLRNISVEVKMPTHLSQDRYGARITHEYGLPFHIVHSSARDPPPRVQYPRRQTLHEYDRLFQVLDPAIQACFRLLGFDGPPMLLNLDMKGRGIPGTRVFLDSTEANSALPDLPDFVESLRQEFARRVTVLWNGYGQKIFFEEARDQILHKGWEIVETREEEIPLPSWLVGRPLLPPHLMTHFTLRRTVIETVQSPPEFCESCYIQHP
jgi:hypothetical protein